MGSYLEQANKDLPDLRSRLFAKIPVLYARLDNPTDIEVSFHCTPGFIVVVIVGVSCVAAVCLWILHIRRLDLYCLVIICFD